MSMDDGPTRSSKTAKDLSIPPGTSPSTATTTSTTARPRARLGIALGSATIAPINMANAYASPNGGGEGRRARDRQGGARRQAPSTTPTSSTPPAFDPEDAQQRDIAADTSYALQQVVENGTGAAKRAPGPPRARPARPRTPTTTCRRRGSWATPAARDRAVMYVRGRATSSSTGGCPTGCPLGYFGATTRPHLDRGHAGGHGGPAGRGLPGDRQPRQGRRPRRGTSRTPRRRRPRRQTDQDAVGHAERDRPDPSETPSQTPTQTPSPTCTLPGGCGTRRRTPTPSGTLSTPPPSQSGARASAGASDRAGGGLPGRRCPRRGVTGSIPASTTRSSPRWRGSAARLDPAPDGTRGGRRCASVLADRGLPRALGMGQKTNCYHDTWQDGDAATRTCATPTSYLYTGRGFAELAWPFQRRRPDPGPLRGDGVPRRHRLLGVRRRLGHPLARNGSPDLDPRRSSRSARCRRPTSAPRDAHLRHRQRAGFAIAGAAQRLAAQRRQPRLTLGRRWRSRCRLPCC